jgi:predicted DNA-binding transcriptional regulator YafY
VIQSLARVPWGWPIEVLLKLPLAEARYRLEPDLGTLEAARGGTLLRTQADNLRWMARLLVQLDCAFRIRHPPELRRAVRDLSREIVANL